MNMIKDYLIKQRDCCKIAIESQEGVITYQQWYVQSQKVSSAIKNSIASKRCNVIICLPNSIDYAIAYFGILFSGNVIVPIAPDCTDSEMMSLIEYCESPLIITNKNAYPRFSRIATDTRAHPQCLIIDECLNSEYTHSEEAEQSEDDEDVCIMLHTSGTMSEPKRVMLTNKNLTANVKSHVAALELNKNDVSLIMLPMFFGYCNTSQFLAHLYVGGKIVIHGNILRPSTFWKVVSEYDISNVTVVPSVLVNLYKAGLEAQAGKAVSRLRYICFGGGRSNPKIIEALIAMFPTIGFVHTYGQTECSPRVTALMPKYALRKSGSVGTAIPNVQMRIVSPDGDILAPDEIGEVCVKGDNVMKGYYKHPELTAQTIRNGWLHTGDEGYVDGDGFLYLCGRLKSMIIYNGVNIYPEEIENVLLASEMVKDAIVYGVDDTITGEIPVADLIIADGYDEQKLRAHCKLYLSSYKIPKIFNVVESIQKTYNKKNKRW